jgi:hypothetical protein
LLKKHKTFAIQLLVSSQMGVARKHEPMTSKITWLKKISPSKDIKLDFIAKSAFQDK